MNFNKVIVGGRLTRDPNLKYLPSGTAVCDFGIAVNEKYTDKNTGEKRENACFLEIQAWQRQAEIANEYLSKGNPVLIEGSLKYESWETDNQEKRSKILVNAQRIQLISMRSEEEGGFQQPNETQAAPPNANAQQEDGIPF